jgi:hypothetical protein
MLRVKDPLYISDETIMSARYYNALVRGHWSIGI